MLKKSTPQKNGKKLSMMLMQLRDLRAKADYDENKGYTYHQAKDALLNANKIISLAKQL